MDEQELVTLLKRFILNTPAKNSEHIEALGWVNQLQRRLKLTQQKLEELDGIQKSSSQPKKTKE